MLKKGLKFTALTIAFVMSAVPAMNVSAQAWMVTGRTPRSEASSRDDARSFAASIANDVSTFASDHQIGISAAVAIALAALAFLLYQRGQQAVGSPEFRSPGGTVGRPLWASHPTELALAGLPEAYKKP